MAKAAQMHRRNVAKYDGRNIFEDISNLQWALGATTLAYKHNPWVQSREHLREKISEILRAYTHVVSPNRAGLLARCTAPPHEAGQRDRYIPALSQVLRRADVKDDFIDAFDEIVVTLAYLSEEKSHELEASLVKKFKAALKKAKNTMVSHWIDQIARLKRAKAAAGDLQAARDQLEATKRVHVNTLAVYFLMVCLEKTDSSLEDQFDRATTAFQELDPADFKLKIFQTAQGTQGTQGTQGGGQPDESRISLEFGPLFNPTLYRPAYIRLYTAPDVQGVVSGLAERTAGRMDLLKHLYLKRAKQRRNKIRLAEFCLQKATLRQVTQHNKRQQTRKHDTHLGGPAVPAVPAAPVSAPAAKSAASAPIAAAKDNSHAKKLHPSVLERLLAKKVQEKAVQRADAKRVKITFSDDDQVGSG